MLKRFIHNLPIILRDQYLHYIILICNLVEIRLALEVAEGKYFVKTFAYCNSNNIDNNKSSS